MIKVMNSAAVNNWENEGDFMAHSLEVKKDGRVIGYTVAIRALGDNEFFAADQSELDQMLADGENVAYAVEIDSFNRETGDADSDQFGWSYDLDSAKEIMREAIQSLIND